MSISQENLVGLVDHSRKSLGWTHSFTNKQKLDPSAINGRSETAATDINKNNKNDNENENSAIIIVRCSSF